MLKAALQAVEDANIPTDLRAIAFTKAIDVLSGSDDTTVRSSGKAENGGGGGGGGGPATESDRLKKIADALSVPQERIEMLFVEHDDELQVAADPARLGSSMKDRAKSVALLVAAGRQLGGWDDGPTGDSVIRAEVDRLGVYDNTNYSRHVKELNAWFNVNGTGRSTTYKLKFPGREYLKTFAKELTQA